MTVDNNQTSQQAREIKIGQLSQHDMDHLGILSNS